MKLFSTSILILLLALPCQAQEIPARYTTQPLPSAWASSRAKHSLVLADVARPAKPPMRINEFVALFGLPDQYLVYVRPRRGYSSMLVYQLPSGHSVVLHVGTPPLQSIGAIAVLERDGTQVRLIK
mgnify:CR=1 FL=1